MRLITLGRLGFDGDHLPGAPDVRPRRLALLAILAAAGSSGVSRDRLLAILWPDSDPDRARHALSQTLYSLRRDLGADAVVAKTELRLDATRITTDLDDFRAAAQAGDWARAAACYAGPFLDGFYLDDAPQFERWVDQERARIERGATTAIEHAAECASRAGDVDAAARLWRTLASIDELSSRFAIGLIGALDRLGDRPGALAHARAHAEVVRRELDTEPDPEVARLVARLRLPTPSSIVPVDVEAPVAAPRAAVGRRRPRIALARSGAVAALLVVAAVATAATGGWPWRTNDVAASLRAEGRRALCQRDGVAARRLLAAAAREDSTSAAIAYDAWRAEVAVSGPREAELADRAIALAARAAERDRLLIVAHPGRVRGDPRALAAAESLVARHPHDAEALAVVGGLVSDPSRGAALLERAVAIDSARGLDAAALCRMGQALQQLAIRHDWTDSSAAVERTLTRWSRFAPGDFTPWSQLADHLVGVGRLADAGAALRRAHALGASPRDAGYLQLAWSLRSDDHELANQHCAAGLALATDAAMEPYRWLCSIALRMQGRYADAEALARGVVPQRVARAAGHRLAPNRIHLAIVAMESGRPRAADAGFSARADEIRRVPALTPTDRASMVTWQLTLAGTAAAAAGDTARVRALADSVETSGRLSTFARDPRLHHFLRGLLLARVARHDSAVREFRAAIHSPSQGYTRINYELARSLLALGRPAEAVAVLRAALHGGVEGAGLYLTRTETHLLLAESFDAAGVVDSAAAHFTIVERAWRGGDDVVAPRHARVRGWLVRHQRATLAAR